MSWLKTHLHFYYMCWLSYWLWCLRALPCLRLRRIYLLGELVFRIWLLMIRRSMFPITISTILALEITSLIIQKPGSKSKIEESFTLIGIGEETKAVDSHSTGNINLNVVAIGEFIHLTRHFIFTSKVERKHWNWHDLHSWSVYELYLSSLTDALIWYITFGGYVQNICYWQTFRLWCLCEYFKIREFMAARSKRQYSKIPPTVYADYECIVDDMVSFKVPSVNGALYAHNFKTKIQVMPK